MTANGFTYGGKGGDAIAIAFLRAAGKTYNEAARLAAQSGDTLVHNVETSKYGTVQVIWKSMAGGNHYNHVHAGVS
jgi:hypothetical protein